MWQKLVMLGTLASMGCLMRASVGEIVATAEGAALFQRMLDNAIDTATAHGYPPDAAGIGGMRRMVADPASAMTASMLRDLESGQRVEADHITGFLLRAARAKGVDDTLFAAAYANLKAYERRREAGRLS
jgi:2-dehydropantoate 2-reductase